MKKVSIASILAVVIVGQGFSLFQSSTDVLKQLGISEEETKDFVWWNLSGEGFSYPNTRQARQTSVSERGAIVQKIGSFAKSYSESVEFKKKYLENREGAKPSPPEKPEPVEEMRKRIKMEMEASIKETEDSIPSLPAELQETMRANVAMMKEQVKEYDNPDNPMFSKEMEQMMMQSYESQLVQHNQDLAEWEKNNPTDPKSMVKRRLERFLEETKDIDFEAGLVEGEYGKRVFAKREYEMKSANWKLCYRAGKEPVEAARAFAKGWLDELKQK